MWKQLIKNPFTLAIGRMHKHIFTCRQANKSLSPSRMSRKVQRHENVSENILQALSGSVLSMYDRDDKNREQTNEIAA